jgi:hypothetical protein
VRSQGARCQAASRPDTDTIRLEKLWAIALPAALVILADFAPMGLVLGAGVGLLLVVPWPLGLTIPAFVRSLTERRRPSTRERDNRVASHHDDGVG